MVCSGRNKTKIPEQFKQAEEITLKLKLLLVKMTHNSKVCPLAENFRCLWPFSILMPGSKSSI
ncbi:hypothetical protein SOVF_022050 [Spinacia oleracea]|nr:hypothetical protein SOVF_022050 [Spinacia oleracea]